MRASERPDCRCAVGGFARRARAHALRAARRLGCPIVLALALVLTPAAAHADERISVTHAALQVRHGTDPGAFVDAQFDLHLPMSLREAVDHGIALYFVIELEVSRSRWYWFDKRLLDDAIEYRISFSPLTRQYRLARGGLAQPFDTLDQALATMRRVTQWRVADAGLLDGGNTQARIRLRLDTSMLPKPFQVSALTDRDWTLVSEWTSLAPTIDGAN